LPMVHGVLAAAYALSGDRPAAHETWQAAAGLRDALPPTARLFVDQYECQLLIADGRLRDAALRYGELAREAFALPSAFVDFEISATRLFLYIRDDEEARRHLASARDKADAHPMKPDSRIDTLALAVRMRGNGPKAPRWLEREVMPQLGEEYGWIERGYSELDRAIIFAECGDAATAARCARQADEAFSAKGAHALRSLARQCMPEIETRQASG